MNESYDVNIFSTSLCNLRCKYCYLSKNDGSKLVDEDIEKSFKIPHYYIDLLGKQKNKIPNIYDRVTRLCIWGGEPLLFLERTFDTIRDFIEACPNLWSIGISSNYAHENVQEAIKGLMNVLAEYPNRRFTFDSQISIDGPEEITDANRGKGVTKKVIENFDQLVKNKYFAPPNVVWSPKIKGTLSKENLIDMENKNYIIHYFKFFDEEFSARYRHTQGVYNLVVPDEYTQEDGLRLAKILKLSKEIFEENKTNHYFKFRDAVLTPYHIKRLDYVDAYDLRSGGCFCGTGIRSISLLPNNMVCGCLQTFEDYCKEYCTERYNKEETFIKDIFIDPTGTYDTHHRRMLQFYPQCNSFPTNFVVSSANNLRMLAAVGHVDKKYLDYETCVRGIRKFLNTNFANCIKNYYEVSGIGCSIPTYALKLMFNGAIDEC